MTVRTRAITNLSNSNVAEVLHIVTGSVENTSNTHSFHVSYRQRSFKPAECVILQADQKLGQKNSRSFTGFFQSHKLQFSTGYWKKEDR